MPAIVEMVVGLKVPDTTAITALQTLQKIGFTKIKNIKRADYYKFVIDGDAEKFKAKICKADILVNANKHSYDFSINQDNSIKILVKNIDDDGKGILASLGRLGLKSIKNVQRFTLWRLEIDAEETEAKKVAENAAKELLVNEHYQEYQIL